MNLTLLLLCVGVILVSVNAFKPQRSLSRSPLKSTMEDIGAVGSKLTNVDLAKEALALWTDDVDKVEMEPTKGGVNNIVQYVKMPTGERKLLRIYNNGLDKTRVTFEHEVLKLLDEQSAKDLSFAVPKMIPAKNSGDATFCTLSNGAEACLVDLIPGELPKLSCVEDIGRASGELNTAMGKLTGVKSECNCDPYYDMWANHHAVTQENFVEMMNGPDFDGDLRPFATFMTDYVLEMDAKIEGAYKGLPEQLIHGDMHYDNILVDKAAEKVT